MSRPRLPPRLGGIAGALLMAVVWAGPLVGQQNLEESRRRLEEIRRERAQLETDRERLQGQVHDLSQELDNLERQRQSTNRIVNEIETQIGGLNANVDQISTDLVLAQDNLAEKRAVLSRRLAEIYKRGSLYPFQVLVAAESFGDLLNRYKYLYLTSRQDRALVSDVEQLRDRVQRQRVEIVNIREQLDRTREEREAELQRYRQLANERARRLKATRRSARTTEQRLSTLERDEENLNDIIAALERARREAESRGSRPTGGAEGNLTTADIGKLDWPVQGKIIYTYGRQQLPSGAMIRRNGIGIGAPTGTDVRAVEAGKVELVQKLGTYGLTVVIQHGNGYRSLYTNLGTATVSRGESITRSQVIGTVGDDTSGEGPHLHFEIRGEDGIALDPAGWLRKRK